MFKIIYAFIISLPEIVRLIAQLQKEIDKQKIDRKVKQDLKTIGYAFRNKDANALNKLFNNQ